MTDPRQTDTPKHRSYTAIATPFNADNIVKLPAMAKHAKWLLDQGCDGLVVFGSTGEATSLTIAERKATLDALIASGIPAGDMVVGTGCCAIADTVDLSSHALDVGCHGVLVMPPFYFKGVSDDGIFNALAETIQGIIKNTGRESFNLYLYHFPKLSGISLHSGLVNRLKDAFPDIIRGYKDSGGVWDNTIDIINNCPGVHVYSGSEAPLSDVLNNGGAGCISATANVQPAEIGAVIKAWEAGDSNAQAAAQEVASKNRMTMQAHPMAAASKMILAKIHGDEDWTNIRPPLTLLRQDDADALYDALNINKT